MARPVTVLSGNRAQGANPAENARLLQDKELAKAKANIDADAELKKKTNKIADLFEAGYLFTGKTFEWFRRPDHPEDVPMYISLLLTKEMNPNLETSLAFDTCDEGVLHCGFCRSADDMEKRHHISLRKKLLNAHGIRYAALWRGTPGKTLIQAVAEIEGQRV